MNSCCLVTLGTGIIGGIFGAAIYNCIFSCEQDCCPVTSSNAFGDFWSVGAQPGGGTLAAGQPLTFGTAGTVIGGISSASMQVNAGTTGTVFTLVNPGVYDVSYRAGYTGFGSLSVFQGTVSNSMAEVTKSIVGQGVTLTTEVFGRVHLTTTVPNSLFAICASAGNGAFINFPATQSITNTNVSAVLIQQIA